MKTRYAPHLFGLLAIVLFVLIGLNTAKAEPPDDQDQSLLEQGTCQSQTYQSIPLIVCRFPSELAGRSLTLRRADSKGSPFQHFESLEAEISAQGGQLEFAMNAGMYHADFAPVGLYRESGEQIAPLVEGASDGNFGMLPNGVFWMHEGRAGVIETGAYSHAFDDSPPDFATQSGPLLVLDGEIHSQFRVGSANVNRRNGVGVSANGDTIYAVVSDNVINFHTFASFFKDELEAPNALYLDGFVSRLWARQIGRHEKGIPLGPMLVMVEAP